MARRTVATVTRRASGLARRFLAPWDGGARRCESSVRRVGAVPVGRDAVVLPLDSVLVLLRVSALGAALGSALVTFFGSGAGAGAGAGAGCLSLPFFFAAEAAALASAASRSRSNRCSSSSLASVCATPTASAGAVGGALAPLPRLAVTCVNPLSSCFVLPSPCLSPPLLCVVAGVAVGAAACDVFAGTDSFLSPGLAFPPFPTCTKPSSSLWVDAASLGLSGVVVLAAALSLAAAGAPLGGCSCPCRGAVAGDCVGATPLPLGGLPAPGARSLPRPRPVGI
mmetsp:Transcript_50865/g.119200  ORF Transcript_50865/g.119200 Transcript_50865/m.119200 type:complete len:282 (+) Transcript_50865:806-1651(+)